MKPYYDCDGVTIYHADCRDVLASLSGVACTVTSPPYNQLSSITQGTPSGTWARSGSGAGFVAALKTTGYSDDLPEAEYQAQQLGILALVQQASKPTASLFYNHQIRWRSGVMLHPVQWCTPPEWNLREEIIWDRAGGMMLNARMFCRFDERILWFVRDKWEWNQEAVGWGTVWRLAREQQQQGKNHPVAFPIEIPLRCIVATTAPGDLVLDPFMGGGTTIRAAKDLGRRAIGIEREERFCEAAAERLAQGVLL